MDTKNMNGQQRQHPSEWVERRLAEAAKRSDIQRIKEMVQNGADINTRFDGKTPLIHMAEKRQLTPENLSLMVSLGADINSSDSRDRWTALMYAAMHGSFTPLLIHSFAAHGADLNARDIYGNTTPMLLARQGILTPDMITAFVQNGARINEKSDSGITALTWSARCNHLTLPLLESFILNGADLNLRDKDGWTALMWLAINMTITRELLEKFIVHGVDINAVNSDGKTPFMLAVLEGNPPEELMNAFSTCGADWNISDSCGQTALMIAAQNKYFTKGLSDTFVRQFIVLDTPLEKIYKQVLVCEKATPVLVSVLLEKMNTDPDTVVSFITTKVKKRLSEWVNKEIPRVGELMFRLIPLMGKNDSQDTAVTLIDF